MTDQNKASKWVYRIALIILILLISYVIFQPQYNFAHWIPHGFLKSIGVPYSLILYVESNADIVLHPLGALILTVLLINSRLPILSASAIRAFIVMCLMMLLAEIIQLWIGRGFEIRDLLLGIVGSYIGLRLSANT